MKKMYNLLLIVALFFVFGCSDSSSKHIEKNTLDDVVVQAESNNQDKFIKEVKKLTASEINSIDNSFTKNKDNIYHVICSEKFQFVLMEWNNRWHQAGTVYGLKKNSGILIGDYDGLSVKKVANKLCAILIPTYNGDDSDFQKRDAQYREYQWDYE